MAYIPQADKLLHFALCAFLALGALPFGLPISVAACVVVVVGREVYGRIRRGRPMTLEDWREAGLDIAAGLTGGAAVLLAATVGV